MDSSLEYEPYINHCRKMLENGASIEDILQYLRKEINSKVNSIFVVMQLLNISPNESKNLVHFSNVWSDVKERDEDFHEEVFSVLEDIEKKNHLK